jgi:hypothetical protein
MPDRHPAEASIPCHQSKSLQGHFLGMETQRMTLHTDNRCRVPIISPINQCLFQVIEFYLEMETMERALWDIGLALSWKLLSSRNNAVRFQVIGKPVQRQIQKKISVKWLMNNSTLLSSDGNLTKTCSGNRQHESRPVGWKLNGAKCLALSEISRIPFLQTLFLVN